MARGNYPTASDVEREMGVAFPELELSENLDYSLAACAAVDEFEQRTKFQPFLGDRTVFTDLKYDPAEVLYPPNGLPLLDLRTGVLVVNSLHVGVAPNSTGRLLVQGTDYFLRPSRAVSKKRPFSYIEFYASWPGLGVLGSASPESIVLNCAIGYWDTLLEDIYSALLQRACSRMIPSLIYGINQGAILVREQDEERHFSEKMLVTQQGTWDKEFERCVRQYERVVIL